MSEHDWVLNYFNYFTEVEEHFQRARGTGLFLLSPLDWALVESWKVSGVPLEAVFRGIDAAFEKWRSRKTKAKVQNINGLAFCAQAVVVEAQAMAGIARPRPERDEAPPFSADELRAYLERNAEAVRQAGFDETAATLGRLAAEAEAHLGDLEQLEQRLTVLEEKLIALARARQTEEQAFEARRELDSQLRPYRGKMTAEQISMLEKQYLERNLLQRAKLPRLSLFYM